MTRRETSDPLSPTQISQLANAKPQGKRPAYFADPMVEQLYAMTMSMMAELATARERIDTLERLLEKAGVLAADDIDEFVPDALAGQERQQAQTELCARILRPLQQQVEALEARNERSVAAMADRLSGKEPGSDERA